MNIRTVLEKMIAARAQRPAHQGRARRRWCAWTACSTRSTSRRPAQELREVDRPAAQRGAARALRLAQRDRLRVRRARARRASAPTSSCSAARPRSRCAHVPVEVPDARGPRAAAVVTRAGVLAARARSSSPGATGSGKSTTLAAMIDTINRDDHAQRHHGRGPDRVPAPRPLSFIHQREVGLDTHVVPRRPALRAAPGPRHHPGRRDPRPGDHGDRAHGRRHRATWCCRRCTPPTSCRPCSACISFYPPHQHDEVRMRSRRTCGRSSRSA